MRVSSYRSNKEAILSKSFEHLVKIGLENISIRELSNGTGISMGSIYYWFGDKHEMVFDVTQYGMEKIMSEMFDSIIKASNNAKEFVDSCMQIAEAHKDEIRFIFQILSSPQYGLRMREVSPVVNDIYKQYIVKISHMLGCDSRMAEPIIYLLISVICDYIIWDDYDKTVMQLGLVRNMFMQLETVTI